MGTSGIRKNRPEWFDNGLRQIEQLHQDWENRLTLENPRFAERYIKAELNIVLRFHVGQSQELFAIFRRDNSLAAEEGNEWEWIARNGDESFKLGQIDVIKSRCLSTMSR